LRILDEKLQELFFIQLLMPNPTGHHKKEQGAYSQALQ
jgi:hypothetical protein